MEIHRGKIKGFRGNWQSGLGYLVIEDSKDGNIESIPCENAPTVRALDACFDNVIDEGHCVKNGEDAGFYDQEVYWSHDEMGIILEAFTPVEDASDELVALYEKGRDCEAVAEEL